MTTEDKPIRLNKYLALQLGISRREADLLIEKKKVTIGSASASLGARFFEGQTVAVQGRTITSTTKYQYILFHKPIHYVCSRKQQGDAPTIYDLIPKPYHTLKPVGRLDRDSSGLILLTNDGDFAYQMTHPKFAKTKLYNVTLDRDLEPLHQQMISDYGVTLDDGVSKLHLERQSEHSRKKWIVIMKEGRNRQIRRTFASLGYTVAALHRTHFGPYVLGELGSGELIETSKK